MLVAGSRAFGLLLALLTLVGIGLDLARAANDPDSSLAPITELRTTSPIPASLDDQLNVNLECRVNDNRTDQVRQIFEICLSVSHGGQRTKLAVISPFFSDCITYRDHALVRSYGEVKPNHGFISVQMPVPKDRAQLDQYKCVAKYMDKDDAPKMGVANSRLPEMTQLYALLAAKMSELRDEVREMHSASTCHELRLLGQAKTPRQKITWRDGTVVLCDTRTDGGGWTIFQHRSKGEVNFHRNWTQYENGFGELHHDFWLGLINLRRLMYEGPQELRIEFAYKGRSYFASYAHFEVLSSHTNYKLQVKGFSGNCPDEFSPHNGFMFSTYDKDHDSWSSNCASSYTGGWWFRNCHPTNLNGMWASKEHGKGIDWYRVTTHDDSATFTEMKTRPVVPKKRG